MSLEADFAALQARVAALEANQNGGDSLTPTYLTIDGQGHVTADFTGIITALGLTIPGGVGSLPGPANEISWQRSSDGAAIANIGATENLGSDLFQIGVSARSPDTTGLLALTATDATGQLALLELAAENGNGETLVTAAASGPVSSDNVTIVSDSHRASFLRVPQSIDPALSAIVGGTLTWPAGSAFSTQLGVTLPGAGTTVGGVVSTNGNLNLPGGAFFDQAVITLFAGTTGVVLQGKSAGGGVPGAGATCVFTAVLFGN